jgi:hypothetical protein
MAGAADPAGSAGQAARMRASLRSSIANSVFWVCSVSVRERRFGKVLA